MGWPYKIVVEVHEDNMGNIFVRPKTDRYARAFAKHVEEFTGHYDETAFFQDGMNSQEFIENHVPKRYLADLRNGWTIRFKEDPWIVGHFYGYDAHCLVESGLMRIEK